MSENYHRIISGNYEWELWVGIISGNYQWELSSENYDLVNNITWTIHGKVEIYRDTGVSKKDKRIIT